MSDVTATSRPRSTPLSAAQVRQYHERGFLCPLPVVPVAETGRLERLFQRLRVLLPAGASTQQMDWWHVFDRELHELCTDAAILDRVESLLGSDFYLWGTQFFAKDPGDGKLTPWHQDAFYWPLHPHRSVTAWLAFAGSDRANGAMQVIPGSHTLGHLQHGAFNHRKAVLPLQLEAGQVDPREAVFLELAAGEMSLHDDRIVHGSQPNRSNRLRCGLTIRYSAGEVKCDTREWPMFQAFWVRGTDRWRHNPVGTPPKSLMTAFREAAATYREAC
jgi:hypothetical protein